MALRPYIVGNWKMNGTRAALAEARGSIASPSAIRGRGGHGAARHAVAGHGA
jgi:triosephosphate isomerase